MAKLEFCMNACELRDPSQHRITSATRSSPEMFYLLVRCAVSMPFCHPIATAVYCATFQFFPLTFSHTFIYFIFRCTHSFSFRCHGLVAFFGYLLRFMCRLRCVCRVCNPPSKCWQSDCRATGENEIQREHL